MPRRAGGSSGRGNSAEIEAGVKTCTSGWTRPRRAGCRRPHGRGRARLQHRRRRRRDGTGAPRRAANSSSRRHHGKATLPSGSATAATEPVGGGVDGVTPPRSAWAFGASDGASAAAEHRPTTAPAAQPAVASSSSSSLQGGGAAGAAEGSSGEHPSWRLAEEQKERGNRRYAIKSWAEAHSCYRKALDELKKHPSYGKANKEGQALASKSASYHANSAAALMQLGKLQEALSECDAALNADRKLGKALLRVAHVQLMLGDTDEAPVLRRGGYVGAEAESEAELRARGGRAAGVAAARAHHVPPLRRFHVSNATSAHQLKTLVATLEAACARAPPSGAAFAAGRRCRRAEGWRRRTRCARRGSRAPPPTARTRPSGSTRSAACSTTRRCCPRRLRSSPSACAHARPCGEQAARAAGAAARGGALGGQPGLQALRWSGAVQAYTRALAVDPAHALHALLYCNRGAHAKNGALQQALADCSAAIALNRSYAKAYLRRAELRVRCGDRTRALEDWRRAEAGRLGRGEAGSGAARGGDARRARERLQRPRPRRPRRRGRGGRRRDAQLGWERARAHQRGGGSAAARAAAGAAATAAAAGGPPRGRHRITCRSLRGAGRRPRTRTPSVRRTSSASSTTPTRWRARPSRRRRRRRKSSSRCKRRTVLSDASQRRLHDAERSRRGGFGGFGGFGRSGFGGFGEDDLFGAFGRGRAGSRR